MKHRPVTPSLRHTYIPSYNFLHKGKPLKTKTRRLKSSAGRNNQGLITVYTKGGGHKRLFREVDFDTKISGIVECIEYDPYRTGFIARVFDKTSLRHSYILASHNLKVGHFVNFNLKDPYSTSFFQGNRYPLSEIPLGSLIHDFSFNTLGKRKIARSAGCGALLLSRNKGFCRIRLSSGFIIELKESLEATLGVVSIHNTKIVF